MNLKRKMEEETDEKDRISRNLIKEIQSFNETYGG
jgi:hypothetical protein